MRCVRPDLTTFWKRLPLRASERSSVFSAGSSWLVARSSAARWTALGNTSLEDWPMLTWSLACTPSPASVAMTSLAFMFDEVPEPVWKTSIGNWSSWRPCAISSAAAAMRWARSASRSPRSAFARAAAPLMRPSQRTTATGTRSPDTGKLATALRVSPPQSSGGTSCTLIEKPPSAVSAFNASAKSRRRGSRDPLRPASRRGSGAERGELPGQPDRVVVGHQEAGSRKHAQLGVRQQVERLLGDGHRMRPVLVGPQQQHRLLDQPVAVDQVRIGLRPAPDRARPATRAVRVAADVGERMAHEIARGRVRARREPLPFPGAEDHARAM